jgi:hypothetical protein
MVARWSANPLGMLWPEIDAAFVASGGGPPGRKDRSRDSLASPVDRSRIVGVSGDMICFGA